MEHLEIAICIDDLKEALCEWDASSVSRHYELEKVHKLIEQLMKDAFEETDPTDRSLLAILEYKARRIRNYIIRRSRMEN